MVVQSQQGMKEAGPPVPWQLRDMGLAAGWLVAAGIVAVFVLGIVFAVAEDISDDGAIAVALGATLALEVAFLAAAAWFSVRRYSCGWQALGFRPAVRGGWWLPLAVVLGAYFTLGIYLLVVELAGLGRLVPQSTLPDDFFDSPIVLPLVGVLAIVAAPIAEETFFRGFLFAGMRAHWGTLRAALASGFLFALLHFNLGSVIPFTIIGMLLAYAYAFSGSLWTAIIAHLVFNTIGFLMGVAAGGAS
ncbi:MAG: lysostaphin resistance A-like protein [Dehalococcoidia bacterium]